MFCQIKYTPIHQFFLFCVFHRSLLNLSLEIDVRLFDVIFWYKHNFKTLLFFISVFSNAYMFYKMPRENNMITMTKCHKRVNIE